MTLTWPDHLLTLEEWTALPAEEGFRLELAEGLLVVSPRPYARHQFAGHSVTRDTNDQLPRALVALAEVEVIVADAPLTIRVPDVVVTPTTVYDTNPQRLAASDVLLAVEVLFDGTRRVDRVLKLSEYADAGIPQYWIIDLGEPTSLLAHVLVDGTYEPSGEHTGTAALDIAGHAIAIDLAALTRR
jgi:Uma2 family endonuclease